MNRNNRKSFLVLISFLAILICYIMFQEHHYRRNMENMVMGGTFTNQVIEDNKNTIKRKDSSVEKYFRPSDMPVLNDRFAPHFFSNFINQTSSEIDLPDYIMKTPKETIINYFSILREAANPQEGKEAGCGSLGNGTTPYPLAYNFLAASYQEKLPYEQYLDTFQNILHISLIKYKEVPVYDNPLGLVRFFVEIETIGGSEKHIADFTYYYGFVDIARENNEFKISNLDFYGEDYLCAPYHGWSADALGSVQVRYGGWCKMIKKLYPVKQEGYIKHIYFKGNDSYDYLIVFFQLTNDTDIEISQYRKGESGEWELIKVDPQKCIKEKSK